MLLCALIAILCGVGYLFCTDKYPRLLEVLRIGFAMSFLVLMLIAGKTMLG